MSGTTSPSPTEATLHRVGAWGPGLFDDDLAADMRDAWDDAIAGGQSPAEATRSVRDSFEQDCADDYDDGPVFWLVLASLQHSASALEPRVRDHAIARIEQNAEKWREESDPDSAAARGEMLATLRGQFTS